MKLHRKRARLAGGLTLVEGPTLVAEAVAGGAVVRTVFGLPSDRSGREAAERTGADFVAVTTDVLGRLATTETPQSPVAVVETPTGDLPDDGHLLAAWGVGDPGNLGTLIRSAAAFGLAFATGPGSVEPWSPKVVRAAAGGHWRVRMGAAADLEALRGSGRALAATVVSGGDDPQTLAGIGDVAVLIGDEARGLPTEVAGACDVRITIPMPGGTESLNAAMTGAILAYLIGVPGNGGAPGRD